MTDRDRYLEPELETMDRADLERLQEDKLLDLIPYIYERSPLIRSVWDEHRVHPRDVKSLDDFRERVPFIDKDAIRRFRDEHRDPYGGLLCLPVEELTAVMSTSGTTGDPTPVPEKWEARDDDRFPALAREFWEIGVRPGDHVTWTLFTFRGPRTPRSRASAGSRSSSTTTRGRWGASSSSPSRTARQRRTRSAT